MYKMGKYSTQFVHILYVRCLYLNKKKTFLYISGLSAFRSFFYFEFGRKVIWSYVFGLFKTPKIVRTKPIFVHQLYLKSKIFRNIYKIGPYTICTNIVYTHCLHSNFWYVKCTSIVYWDK